MEALAESTTTKGCAESTAAARTTRVAPVEITATKDVSEKANDMLSHANGTGKSREETE